MMSSYKCIRRQTIASGLYSIVPIRYEDRYLIMQWRNEQMYHLRQNVPLTKEQQDLYFNTVVASLFEQVRPGQILFSYLKNDECIGYGGLVHIDWVDKRAEISFLLNITHIQPAFTFHWKTFLSFIENIAFIELNLHKIYTYAYDLRENLYCALESCGFIQEARLKEHLFYSDKYIDVVIHAKINS